MPRYPKWLDAQLLVCVSLIYFHTLYIYMLWDGALAIFSENRVLTFVVILRNKMGGSSHFDLTFVGSF